jgi:LysM repeat protein
MLRLFIVLVAVLLVGCNLSSEPPTPTPGLEVASCDAIVNTAIETADQACASLGRNEACYGNNLVQADAQENASITFNIPGDVIDLLSVQRLSASPIDQVTGVWGVAVVKAQANIPDTLPGQSVTFLLFGDTSLDNISPDMRTVVLSTGIGETTCTNAPPSALLMQSPEGVPVTMNFNGAEIRLGSTVYVTAVENGEMTVATIEGSATVTAQGTSQTVLPNTQVRMQLGTDDGLHVVGPPSAPEPFNLDLVGRAMLTLLETTSPPTQAPAQTSTPAPTVAPTRPPQPTTTNCVPRSDWTANYIVQQGDTLGAIARNYNVTVAEMQQANCLANPDAIGVGQVLRVPFVRVTNTPRPTNTSTNTPTPPPTFTPTTPPKATDTPVPIPLPTETQVFRSNRRFPDALAGAYRKRATNVVF